MSCYGWAVLKKRGERFVKIAENWDCRAGSQVLDRPLTDTRFPLVCSVTQERTLDGLGDRRSAAHEIKAG